MHQCAHTSPKTLATVTVLTATALLTGAIAGGIGLFPSFDGADAGVPIPATAVAFPLVSGPSVAPPSGAVTGAPELDSSMSARGAASAFQPSFNELVTGETVITTNAQMQSVWETLFDEPYAAGQFDFQNNFVVLMGGGLMHPWFGFHIGSVEQFESTWSDGGQFPTSYVEHDLAIAAVTTLPGVKPKPMDPEFKVAAVQINRTFLSEVLFNRQVFAAP